jgi:release factor glutamine methyltransferase
MIYEPREDSELLLAHVAQYARGSVLDMGTGSGVLAEEAALSAESVLGVDVSESVVTHCQTKYPHISFRQSDLFSNVMGKFDCILFNPPYLPEDVNEDSESSLITTGGKFGWETIERFLFSARNHLHQDGVILLVFSTATNKRKVEDLIDENGFTFIELGKKRIPWEMLYVYRVERK